MRKFIYTCCILSILIFPVTESEEVFADTQIQKGDTPTLSSIDDKMNVLIQNISDNFLPLSDKLMRAQGTIGGNQMPVKDFQAALLDASNVYVQARSWIVSSRTQMVVSPRDEMDVTRSTLLDYDRKTFGTVYQQIQQQVDNNNKEQVLQLLRTLQEGLQGNEKNVKNLLAKITSFNNDLLAKSRKLKSDLVPVHSFLVTAQATWPYLLPLYAGLLYLTDDMNDNLYQDVGISYTVDSTLARPVSELEKSVMAISDIWNELDSTLVSTAAEVQRASQVNPVFIKARLQTVQKLWKSLLKPVS